MSMASLLALALTACIVAPDPPPPPPEPQIGVDPIGVVLTAGGLRVVPMPKDASQAEKLLLMQGGGRALNADAATLASKIEGLLGVGVPGNEALYDIRADVPASVVWTLLQSTGRGGYTSQSLVLREPNGEPRIELLWPVATMPHALTVTIDDAGIAFAATALGETVPADIVAPIPCRGRDGKPIETCPDPRAYDIAAAGAALGRLSFLDTNEITLRSGPDVSWTAVSALLRQIPQNHVVFTLAEGEDEVPEPGP